MNILGFPLNCWYLALVIGCVALVAGMFINFCLSEKEKEDEKNEKTDDSGLRAPEESEREGTDAPVQDSTDSMPV